MRHALSGGAQTIMELAKAEATVSGFDNPFGTGDLAVALLSYASSAASNGGTRVTDDDVQKARNLYGDMLRSIPSLAERRASSFALDTGMTYALSEVLLRAAETAEDEDVPAGPASLLKAMRLNPDCTGSRILEKLGVSQEYLVASLKAATPHAGIGDRPAAAHGSDVDRQTEEGYRPRLPVRTARNLQRVVVVGQKQSAFGFTVAVTSVEMYKGGVVHIRYLISSSVDYGKIPLLGLVYKVRVQDQSGTCYEVGQGSFESYPWGCDGKFEVGPLDPTTKELEVRFEELESENFDPGDLEGGDSAKQRSWKGPWEFRFSIGEAIR